MPKRVLISTLPPQLGGGVVTMTNFIVDCLERKGYDITLAYYYPYSLKPMLSVPIQKLFRQCPKSEKTYQRKLTCYGIGAYLPELEFTHYHPHGIWKKLIGDHDYHVVVSGHALAALPFYKTQKKCLAWLASPFDADRSKRLQLFPWYRKILDRLLVAPVCRHYERKILANNPIMALSYYTQKQLQKIVNKPYPLLSMPINTKLFKHNASATIPWRILFVGRFNDPRKNIPLLLNAITTIVQKQHPITLDIVGSDDPTALVSMLKKHQLHQHVCIHAHASQDTLLTLLQSADLFVIPSQQEGLCIAALEAMACGCPVISTKCGGPEEFVIPEKTGTLVDFDSNEMAQAIISICSDRTLRQKLSQGALHLIQRHYSYEAQSKQFYACFEHYKT